MFKVENIGKTPPFDVHCSSRSHPAMRFVFSMTGRAPKGGVTGHWSYRRRSNMAIATKGRRRVLAPQAPAAPSSLRNLFRWAGIAATAAAILTPVWVGIFAASPPPGYDEGARVWFEHIQDNEILGLLSLEFPFLIITALMIR